LEYREQTLKKSSTLDADSQARMKYLRLLLHKEKFNRLVPGMSFFHDQTPLRGSTQIEDDEEESEAEMMMMDDRQVGLRMVEHCLLNKERDERMAETVLFSFSPQTLRTVSLTPGGRRPVRPAGFVFATPQVVASHRSRKKKVKGISSVSRPQQK